MKETRTQRIARMNKEANPYGANRNTRRANAAFERKDNRNKKPSTDIVEKKIKGFKKPQMIKVNMPCKETVGAFGRSC